MKLLCIYVTDKGLDRGQGQSTSVVDKNVPVCIPYLSAPLVRSDNDYNL